MSIWAHSYFFATCIQLDLSEFKISFNTLSLLWIMQFEKTIFSIVQDFLPHTFTFVNHTICAFNFFHQSSKFLSTHFHIYELNKMHRTLFPLEFENSFHTLLSTNARVGMFGDFLLLSTKDSPRWPIPMRVNRVLWKRTLLLSAAPIGIWFDHKK